MFSLRCGQLQLYLIEVIDFGVRKHCGDRYNDCRRKSLSITRALYQIWVASIYAFLNFNDAIFFFGCIDLCCLFRRYNRIFNVTGEKLNSTNELLDDGFVMILKQISP